MRIENALNHVVPDRSREIHLAARPQGALRLSDFRLVETEVRGPRAGEVLVRNTWTSVDPSTRIRLLEHGPPGYLPRFEVGEALSALAVGEVVASEVDGFAPGDAVSHALGWRDYAVVGTAGALQGGLGRLTRIDVAVAPAPAYLGALGAIGLTAYAGLLDVAGLKEGDVVWVSGAAGAVGSLAAQIAKRRGHRVIGSAGSDAKVAYLLDELGLDAAFNYKAGPLDALLSVAAPDGIDVYFDNVGGSHLEAALGALRPGGRVAMCGAISGYETETAAPGPGNLFQAVIKDLTIRGFRAGSHTGRIPDMTRDLGGWLRDGLLTFRETVYDGLERTPEALIALMQGDTVGKTLVRIA